MAKFLIKLLVTYTTIHFFQAKTKQKKYAHETELFFYFYIIICTIKINTFFANLLSYR